MLDFQFQLDIEKMFNNNQLFPRIKREFMEAGWGQKLQDADIPERFGYALLVQMVLHKRASLPVLMGILRDHFLDQPKPSQACVDMLHKACEADLMNWDTNSEQFIIIWDVSQDVYDDLERYQYPMPMVIPPKEVRNNTDSGYITLHESIILKNNHHEDDVCLDHINRCNQVPLLIDPDVARMVQLRWKNLDSPKDGEGIEEYQKRVKAFQKYERTAYEVMEHLNLTGSPFYLTHAYDFRGRTYARGYHTNYQGTEWNKSVIRFAEEEVPT